jgi:hypothetical protein
VTVILNLLRPILVSLIMEFLKDLVKDTSLKLQARALLLDLESAKSDEDYKRAAKGFYDLARSKRG